MTEKEFCSQNNPHCCYFWCSSKRVKCKPSSLSLPGRKKTILQDTCEQTAIRSLSWRRVYYDRKLLEHALQNWYVRSNLVTHLKIKLTLHCITLGYVFMGIPWNKKRQVAWLRFIFMYCFFLIRKISFVLRNPAVGQYYLLWKLLPH